MAGQDSDSRIFQKWSVGFLESEFYGFVVYFLRGNPLPAGPFGAFHSRVFYFFYSKNYVIGSNRRSVLPKNIRFKGEGVDQAVFRNVIFFHQVVNQSAAIVLP